MNLADAEPSSDERFVALFLDEYPGIVRLAYLMLGDRAAAEDVAQEAFARMYGKWWRVSRYERPGAWVRRVAIRLAGRARTERSRESPLADDHPAEETTASAGDETHDLVLALPFAQRTAVILRYYEDRPLNEVADMIGCSSATARVHLHRARKRLAKLLEEAGDVAR